MMLAALRDARWLGPARGRGYLNLVAVAMLLLVVAVAAKTGLSAWNDPLGRPTIGDFDAFWTVSRLGLTGHAALAYDQGALRLAEAVPVQPSHGQYLPYFYPPVFSLICLPLGLLGYLPALAAFIVAGTTASMLCLRRILPAGWPGLVILAFPGLLMNAAIGQAGFLATLCFSGALLLLERRPFLAGTCLGALAYRPQLAICVPIALVAARRWRALAGCMACAIGLGVASVLVLGWGAWAEFVAAMPMIARVPQMHDIMPKLLSVYGAVRALHGGAGLGYAVQAASAVSAMLALAWITARKPGAGAEMSALVAAALLCSPYVLDYDLACLAVPLAWLAGRGGRSGWLPWEKAGLTLCYVLPLVARTLTMTAGVPITPILVAALLALVGQRSVAA